MKRFFYLSAALLAAMSLALVPASAQTYDLFQTDGSQHPSVNLSAIPGLSPSTVSFQGSPISTPSCLGNTDTIIQRSDAGGNLQPVVAALNLKNVAGTGATYNGNPVDVFATINSGVIDSTIVPAPDNPSQTSGTMTLGSDGSFSSTLNVNPDIVLKDSSGAVVASFTDDSFKTTLSATGATGPPSSTTPNCSQFPNGGIVVIRIAHTAPTHVHQVIPACASSTSGATSGPVGTASIGGGVVVDCAVLATTTNTSATKSAAKPQ